MNQEPTARIVGQKLESLLDDTVHPQYLRDGLLIDIWHEGQRAIYTQSGLKPVDSRPDYGAVLPDGRFACFDAKHCQERRYRHNPKRLHQLRAIWKVYKARGVAGILVANLPEDLAWWLVPQPHWANEEFHSVVLGEMPYSIPVPAHTGFWSYVPDWLTTAVNAREV